MARYILVFCLITFIGWSGKLAGQYPLNNSEPINIISDSIAKDFIQLHYSGSGGLIIQTNNKTILVDPFFSNMGFGKILAKTLFQGLIKPDSRAIDFGLKRSGMDISNTEAILVSHAHYDHLLDVPWLLDHRISNQPKVYGSNTAKFIVEHFTGLSDRIESVESIMATRVNSGTWLPIAPGIRVLPIKSHHASHFLGIKLYRGGKSDNFKLKDNGKSKLNHWKEGQTLSYLFEFSKGDRIFNMFVQTSASKKPLGLPPQSVIENHPIDLAILCVASYGNVDEYPQNHLRNLDPESIVFVHWENFFRDYRKPPKPVPGTNVKKFIRQVSQYRDPSKFWLPNPGTTINITY